MTGVRARLYSLLYSILREEPHVSAVLMPGSAAAHLRQARWMSLLVSSSKNPSLAIGFLHSPHTMQALWKLKPYALVNWPSTGFLPVPATREQTGGWYIRAAFARTWRLAASAYWHALQVMAGPFACS